MERLYAFSPGRYVVFPAAVQQYGGRGNVESGCRHADILGRISQHQPAV